ncbi:unnamed protein product [Tilletia controversa]|nr:hypothetical protein CF335_g3572 [Tilletia laevis]CAD6938897.1 unnamed protein product [Tilletia caries]CAD6946334.1 unnamed protein product [Tilletia controversa]CAD7063668.1 unnamed protein product [Tilletia caries]
MLRVSRVQTSLARAAVLSYSQRALHSSCPRRVQRLLWAGAVLDETSPKLRAATSAWLAALGMGQDAQYGISFTQMAASTPHSLLAYRTLAPSPRDLPAPESEHTDPQEEERDDPSRPKLLGGEGPPGNNDSPLKYVGLEKIISVGRNTFSELGLGFSSHESTWGMVRSLSNFSGSHQIKQLGAGHNTSWAVTSSSSSGSSDMLFAWGNHSLGQLGLGSVPSQSASTSGDAQLQLYSTPKQVELPPIPDSEDEDTPYIIDKVAVGLDHALVLRSWTRKDGERQSQVLGCGLNTDAQLGLPLHISHTPHLTSITVNDNPTSITAGADTSFSFRPGSTSASAWGNSEYAQALWGSRPIDRVECPVSIEEQLHDAIGDDKVKDITAGGSFSLVLTESGRVFAAGYGAIGKEMSSSAPQSFVLQEVAALAGHNVRKIASGLEYACAITDEERIFVWGLDSRFGRLGLRLGDRPGSAQVDLRVFQPREVPLSPSVVDDSYRIEGIACGGDVMWVLVEQEDGTGQPGRWLGR